MLLLRRREVSPRRRAADGVDPYDAVALEQKLLVRTLHLDVLRRLPLADELQGHWQQILAHEAGALRVELRDDARDAGERPGANRAALFRRDDVDQRPAGAAASEREVASAGACACE